MAPNQIEGTEIVTVARDGARTANVGGRSFPIYTTAIYRAIRRVRDGVVTWRRIASVSYHATSGNGISGAMVERARQHAIETNREFRMNVRHGYRVEV